MKKTLLEKRIMIKKIMASIVVLILFTLLTILTTGCAGLMDTTFKCLDAATAVLDCTDGEEYSQEEAPTVEEEEK